MIYNHDIICEHVYLWHFIQYKVARSMVTSLVDIVSQQVSFWAKFYKALPEWTAVGKVGAQTQSISEPLSPLWLFKESMPWDLEED